MPPSPSPRPSPRRALAGRTPSHRRRRRTPTQWNPVAGFQNGKSPPGRRGSRSGSSNRRRREPRRFRPRSNLPIRAPMRAAGGGTASWMNGSYPPPSGPNASGPGVRNSQSESEERGGDPRRNETAREPDEAQRLVPLFVLEQALRVRSAVDAARQIVVRGARLSER